MVVSISSGFTLVVSDVVVIGIDKKVGHDGIRKPPNRKHVIVVSVIVVVAADMVVSVSVVVGTELLWWSLVMENIPNMQLGDE